MVMNWTDTHDKEMLLHIITASSVKVDNQAIANHLNATFGTDTTAKAVKEHFAGLKKKHAAALLTGGSAPSTPNKPSTTTPKRGKKVAAADLNDGDDEEASPSKKRKVAPRSARKVTSYKQEDEEVDGEEIPVAEELGYEMVKEEEVESEEE